MKLSGSAFYFDQAAERYTSQYHAQTPAGYALRERQRRILELLDHAGGKILDVGCGPAFIAPALFNMGYEYWGVDAAPGMIQQYRKQSGATYPAHLAVGDIAQLSFPNESFDALICIGVLDRIQDHEATFAEMARVLKPNGTLVIWFPNLISPYAFWKNFVFYPMVALLRPMYFRLLKRREPPSIYNRTNGSGFGCLFSSFAKLRVERSTAEQMKEHGFEVTGIVYTNFNLFLSPLDEWFPQMAMRTTERLQKLRFGKLKWLGAGFIVKARKIA